MRRARNSCSLFAALMLLIAAVPAAVAQQTAPVTAQHQFRDAYELHRQGKEKEAADLFRGGLQQDAGNAVAWFYLGESLAAQGDRASAESSFRKSLALDPNSKVAAKAREYVD